MVISRHILGGILGVILSGSLVGAGEISKQQGPPAVKPSTLPDEYAIYRWQSEDGLPEDSVVAVTLSSDGYLWCLTDRVLSRFDGNRFQVVDWPPNTRETGWTGINETGGDTLWMVGERGAFRIQGGNFSKLFWSGSSMPDKVIIQRVMQGPDRVLWAAGSNGVYRLEGRHARFFSLPKPPGKPPSEVNAAEMGSDGQIWLASGSSIMRFEHGTFAGERVPVSGDVQCLSIGRDGVVWAATSTNLLCRLGGHWQMVQAPPYRSHPRWRITTLRAFDAGELWVGTTSGLWRLKGGEWSELSPRDGYYPLEIRSITRDTEGNIWVGSSGGLLRLRRKAVQMYDSGLVLHRHSFTAVLPESAGGLWVGVAGGGLLEGIPGAFRPYGLAPVSRTAVISALLKSRDGSLWIGTQGDYLWRCHDGKADCIAEPPHGEDSAVNVNALIEDRRGRVWVGTGGGLMIYNASTGQLDPVQGVPSEVRVHALLEDRDGSIWAGLQGAGLVRMSKEGAVSVFRRQQGLPSDTIMALCQDADGMVWAGTAEGLGRWDGFRWVGVTDRQGLPEGPLSQLLEDGANLWVGTRYGITRLSRQELAEVAAGQKMLLTPQSFGHNEGMRDEQCSSGFGNLAAKDGAGQLWFSTLDGLVMIDPKRVVEKSPGGLRVYIEDISVNRKPVKSFHDILAHGDLSFTVPAGGGAISIRYSAPFFSAPEQVQFKRMLEGYDLAWSAPTTSRSMMYARLPPGKYRFRVMAGVGGSWRESIQTIDFTVNPFVWQRRWFWLAMGSLILALVGLWVRANEKRRNRRKFLELEREQALDRERSRIAHDLHDDLGASLTEIGLLSAVAMRPTVTPERARKYLGDITEKIRVMVDTLDEIVWAINPRNDTVSSLGNYFCECAQRMLQLTTIRCRLDLAPDLPSHPLDPDRRHNLFLAFNEALNNVIRHSGGTEVWIRISAVRDGLVVAVEDNGRGLAEGAVSEGAEGLKSMRHRLERMGGRCDISSHAGQGTCVRFTVPLEPGGTP